jgi:CheY-like chemotaxis protein
VSQNPGDGGRPLKVLHVDDDPMNLRVVQEILAAFGLALEGFDVVLLDIHMPGMTGLDVIQRLRGCDGPQRDVPVIALTADVYSRRPAEYLALGFNDFMSKPILVSSLMAAIRRCAEQTPPALRRAS